MRRLTVCVAIVAVLVGVYVGDGVGVWVLHAEVYGPPKQFAGAATVAKYLSHNEPSLR